MAGFEDLDDATRVARFSLLETFVDNGVSLYSADESILGAEHFADKELEKAAIAFRNAYTSLAEILTGYASEIPSYPTEAENAGLLAVGEDADTAASRIIEDLISESDFE